MQAAVEREVSAGGVTALVRGNPGNDGGDFFRCAQPLGRHAGNDFFQHIRTDRLDHVSADVTRADSVDGDAFAGELLRQRHGEAVQASLGGGVVDLTELAFLAVDRRNIDHASEVRFDHAFDHLLGHVEHAVEVGRNNSVPVGLAHFAELAVARDTRVVDQHADLTVLGFDLVKGSHRGIPVADIAHRSVKAVAQCFLFVQPFTGVAGRTATGNDLEPVFGQSLADGRSNAAHAAGNVCDFLCHVCSIDFY